LLIFCLANGILLSGDGKQNLDIQKKLVFTNYMHVCPELLGIEENYVSLKDITYQNDIWSLGIILLQIFTNKYNIYNNISFIDKKRNVYDETYLLDAVGNVENCFIKAIIFRLVSQLPEQRPNIFLIIDNYNKFIKAIRASDTLLIPYTLDQIRSKIKKY